MSRVLLLCVLVMGSLSLEGVPQPIVDANPIHEAFITPVKDPGQIPIVASSPPAPLYEQIPERPYDDAVWIPGYWAWSDAKNNFTWICGVWRRPPPERIWIPGSWVPAQGGFAWQSGLWSLVPEDQLAYIQKTPPPQPNEQIPPAPGENYFWVKGYWEYQPQSDSYSWLSGSWEQIDPHWILSPSIYVWRQSGFVFVPLLWDYTLEERGEAYSCADGQDGQPVAIEAPQIIEQLYFYYPDYINIYWHWGVYHPGWWDGCGCLPPWWGWNDWWTLPWGDAWGLWWWWGHPGSAAPVWMTPELSMSLAPPPAHLLPLFEKAHKPSFPINKGGKGLLPKGPKSLGKEPKGQKPLPRPKIPDTIKPGGSIKPPSLPGRFVLPQDSLRQKGKGQRDGTFPGQQVNPDRVNPRWETAPANVRPKVWIPPKERRPGRGEDGDRPDRAKGSDITPPGYTPSDGSESPQWRRPSRRILPPSENLSDDQGDAMIKKGPSQPGKPARFTPSAAPQDNAPPSQQSTVIKQAPPQFDRPARVNFPSRQQGKGNNALPPSQGTQDVQQAAPRQKRELPELTPRIRERIKERSDNKARSKTDDQ